MQRVIIHQDIEAFRDAKSIVEVCDPQGNRLGFYSAAPPLPQGWKPKFTREEVEERCKGPKKSYRQVLEHLLSLATTDEQKADLHYHIQLAKEREGCDTP